MQPLPMLCTSGPDSLKCVSQCFPCNKRSKFGCWCIGNSGWSTPRRSLSTGRGSPWAAPSRGPPSVASSMASITERPQRRQPPIKREYSGAILASHTPLLVATHCHCDQLSSLHQGFGKLALAAGSYCNAFLFTSLVRPGVYSPDIVSVAYVLLSFGGETHTTVLRANLQHNNLGYQVSMAQQEQGCYVAHSSRFAAGVWCPCVCAEPCNKNWLLHN